MYTVDVAADLVLKFSRSTVRQAGEHGGRHMLWLAF